MEKELVAELARAVKAEQHKSVLQLCAKLANVGGQIGDYIVKCKVTALLHDNRWTEAVAACGSLPALTFEKAYALYKAEQYEAALALLTESGVAPISSRHLRAQLLFRLHRFDDSAAAYEQLLGSLLEEEADAADVEDARLNFAAALIAAGRSRELLSNPRFRDITEAVTRDRAADLKAGYELVYNIACAFADNGQHGCALRALASALSSGEAVLQEEGESPAKVAEDLSIVRAQAAYVLQCSHFDEAALALYGQVHASRPTDPAVAAASASNQALLCSGRQLLEAYKRLRSVGSSTRFLPRQSMTLLYNRAVLSFRVHRVEEARAALGELRVALRAAASVGSTPAPNSGFLRELEGHAGVLEAAMSAPGSGGDAAAGTQVPAGAASGELLRLLAAAGPNTSMAEGDVTPSLAARAQLLADAGDFAGAADLLHPVFAAAVRGSGGGDAAALASLPPLAASLVQLYASAEPRKSEACSAVLDEAVTALRRHARDEAAVLPLISALHLRAAYHAFSSNVPAAAADLKDISALPSASPEQRAAALVSLALLKARAPSSALSSTSPAEVLLSEAAALSPAAASGRAATRRPSFADAGQSTSAVVDALEWGAVAPAGETAGADNSKRAAAAALLPAKSPTSTAAPAHPSATSKRRAARRARAKVAYLAKLKASGKFDILGLPAPDPERWLKKKDRTYGRKPRRKQVAKMNVSSGGAQGGASGAATDALTLSLDAKAKADAVKAKGEAAPKGKGDAGSKGKGAPFPSPTPPASLPSSAGKRKSKGK